MAGPEERPKGLKSEARRASVRGRVLGMDVPIPTS